MNPTPSSRLLALLALPVLLAAVFGLARPADAGLRRWTPLGPGGGSIQDLAVDPASPQIVWGADVQGLFKSEDAGTTWRQVLGGYPLSFQRVAVDPGRPGTVFAGGSRLLRSTDGGASWTTLSLPVPVSVLAVVPRVVLGQGGPATVYAGSAAEIYKSADDGETWTRVFAAAAIQAVVVDPEHPDTVYVAFADGIWKSLDGGASWDLAKTVPGGEPLQRIRLLAIAPSQPQTLYTYDFYLRLFRSDDSGATWTRVGTRRVGTRRVGTRRVGDGLDPTISYSALAVDPVSPSTLYLAGPSSLTKSTDGGETWQTTGGTYGDPAYPLYVAALDIDPGEPRYLYLGGFLVGVGRSRDAGEHWRFGLQEGLWDGEFGAVRLHPTRPGTLYAFVNGGRGQSFASPDGGRSWTRFALALGPQPLLDIAFDTSAAEPVLYVGTGRGVFQSADGGATWSQVLDAGAAPLAVVGPGTILAATSGLRRSADGGRSWRQVLPPTVPLPGGELASLSVRDLAVAPADPSQVYALVSLYRASGLVTSSLYASRDRGITWRERRPGAQKLAVDPSRPGTVYVIGEDGWLVRSTNGGRSWTRLSRVVRTVVVDPRHPQILYGASPDAVLRSTDGGLTWKRASAGLPDLYPSSVRELLADPAFPGHFYAELERGALHEATFPGPGR